MGFLSRSTSNSYFGSDLKRTQSRPNLISKETSPLKLKDEILQSSGNKNPRGSKPIEDVGELLLRHNSYSLITDSKRERNKPAMIKVDTASDHIALLNEKGSSRLTKNTIPKPESNYGKFKKTVVKKRASNMLFSKLGFANENKPSNRFDTIINNRKPNDSGSINLRNKETYLMGRLSPHSQASLGENFRFDFLDHSSSGQFQLTQTGQLPQKAKKSNRAMPYIAIQGENASKPDQGSRTKQTTEFLEHSDSSTSLSNIESNLNTLTAKIQDTSLRLANFLEAYRVDQKEKLATMEAIARENGILKDKLKAAERKGLN